MLTTGKTWGGRLTFCEGTVVSVSFGVLETVKMMRGRKKRQMAHECLSELSIRPVITGEQV